MKHLRRRAGKLLALLFTGGMDTTPPDQTTLVAVQRGDDGSIIAAIFHRDGTDPPAGIVRDGSTDTEVENLQSVIKHGGWEQPA